MLLFFVLRPNIPKMLLVNAKHFAYKPHSSLNILKSVNLHKPFPRRSIRNSHLPWHFTWHRNRSRTHPRLCLFDMTAHCVYRTRINQPPLNCMKFKLVLDIPKRGPHTRHDRCRGCFSDTSDLVIIGRRKKHTSLIKFRTACARHVYYLVGTALIGELEYNNLFHLPPQNTRPPF